MTKAARKRRKIQMPAGIRNKMMAAISMLLVSSVMIVSSTYAWFTLSTAPEVTGITTNVGANGNLEMMLLNTETFSSTDDNLGVESKVGDSSAVQEVTKANETWGNLVDLSASSYGLSSIVLMPSKLNISGTAVQSSPLLAPSYGTDGRVIKVDTATYPGAYASGSWTYDDTAAGVRALGTSSGTTVRLSAYRTALAQANSATSSAKTTAQNSLSANAQPLATLLMGKVQGQTSFEISYLENLQSIITGVTNANDYVETAIRNAVIAYSLSANNRADLSDDDVNALKDAINAAELSALAGLSASGVTLPSGIEAAITTYGNTAAALSTSKEALEELKATNPASLTWEQINGVLQPLVNEEMMTVNGYAAEAENKNNIIDSAIPDGDITKLNIEIKMLSGSGVYYNIASVCGAYVVSGKVSVTYNGMSVNAPFTMTQDVTTSSMSLAIAAIQNAGAPEATVGGAATVTLSDTYGYMLDFGFRTNAAGSKLQLQTSAIQRVYNSTGNPSDVASTQGSGSYMQFTSADISTFSIDEVRALMSAIRVAFVQPNLDDGTYTMLAMGALDITGSDEDNDGVITYTGGTISTTDASNYTLKADLSLHNYTVADDGKVTLGAKRDDSAIVDMAQNIASKVTVIVYLDGEIVDNTMVANAAQSMSGSMNIQFSSSASLVPMENTGMRAGGAAATDSTVTYEQKATAGGTYTFGNYTGTVKEGCTIYLGSDGETYYSTNGGTTKYQLTTSNYSNAITVTVTQ